MPEQSEPSGLERVFAEHAAVDAFDRERSLGPGELSPRARVQARIDAGSDSFLVLGARPRSQRPEARESSYGDGVVTAFGEVGGRMTAVLADDPVAMAQSDGGVGKNKRIRTLTHAAQGCLPVVYFAQAAPADLPAPEEGGLLGRYSDGPLIVPEVHFDDRSAPIVTILGGEVAPELQALALDSDVVLRTPGGGATPIPSDVSLPDDAGAIATAATLMRLIPTRDAAPLRRAADAPAPASAALADEGASDLGAAAVAEALCDGGSIVPFAADDAFAAGLAALNGYPVAYVVGGGTAFTRAQLEIFRRVVGIGARFAMPLILAQHGVAYDEEALGTTDYRRLVGEIAATIHGAETPKIAIISRRGQSAGDFILGGRELGTHYVIAWPDADVSTSEASPFTAARAGALDGMGPWDASGLALVDDVVAPGETRARLGTMLEIMAPIRALPPVVEDKKGRVPYR
ncbi:MAG: hypothetical protein OXI03_02845 [Chloroflexota bacterium]|nr:hypothetical protein [Chloroflexota bacterium]